MNAIEFLTKPRVSAKAFASLLLATFVVGVIGSTSVLSAHADAGSEGGAKYVYRLALEQ